MLLTYVIAFFTMQQVIVHT